MIGDNVRKLRKDKGFSLDQLAKKVGSSKAYIWEIEKERTSPKLVTAFKLAEALEVSVDLLIDINIDKTSTEERNLIKKYRRLDPGNKWRLLKFADILYDVDADAMLKEREKKEDGGGDE